VACDSKDSGTTVRFSGRERICGFANFMPEHAFSWQKAFRLPRCSHGHRAGAAASHIGRSIALLRDCRRKSMVRVTPKPAKRGRISLPPALLDVSLGARRRRTPYRRSRAPARRVTLACTAGGSRAAAWMFHPQPPGRAPVRTRMPTVRAGRPPRGGLCSAPSTVHGNHGTPESVAQRRPVMGFFTCRASTDIL